jgi:hypothetical protein
MKARAFIIAALAMLLVVGNALAQSGTTGAYGSVSVPLMLEDEQDMQAGDMQRNVLKTVQLTPCPSTNGTTPAAFAILGDEQDAYTVTSMAASLTWVPAAGQTPAPGDVTTMTGTNFKHKAHTANTPCSAVSGTSYLLSGIDGPNKGVSWLWVGCDFTPDPIQQRGNYSGTASVTVAYFP